MFAVFAAGGGRRSGWFSLAWDAWEAGCGLGTARRVTRDDRIMILMDYTLHTASVVVSFRPRYDICLCTFVPDFENREVRPRLQGVNEEKSPRIGLGYQIQ